MATDQPPVLQFDDITYAILPGQATGTTAVGVGTLKWQLAIPQSPPKTTTPS
jgi:hypothetical protein